jgi:ABC-type amino acid transport system permease subunit
LVESIAIFLILLLIIFSILELSSVAFPIQIKTASNYSLLATIYYILADAFVENILLNLTPGRIQDLNLPFNILPEAVENTTWVLTSFFSIIIVSGFALLENGNIKPRQYDRAIQLLTVIAFIPFILYFWLHIKYLKQTDGSWLFEFDFMEEMAGFTLTNQWPFETVLQDTRWEFYRVGLFNSIRVVIISIIGSTILGVLVGVSRLSRNKLLSGLAESYVEFFRNMPLVVQLFFLSTVVFGEKLLKPFSEIQEHHLGDWFYWSNRGIVGPDFGIENMQYCLAAFAVYLAARTYIRLTERILPDSSESLTVPSSRVFSYGFFYVEKAVAELLGKFGVVLGRKNKSRMAVAVDIFFSLSILIAIYGLFNVVEWNYKISTIEGLLANEPFSMFKLGVIMLITSGLLRFKLDDAGLNNFTADDSIEGQRNRSILWAVTLLSMFALFYMAIWYEQPILLTEKNGEPLSWGLWRFKEGTETTMHSVFLTLCVGLILYTAAQIAEIVRGSIQSLPRGQVEAAISLGLSPYQRLNLVILPQALRSMIPSLTNQYLNCWKNSSLAFVIGFSDFYAVFNTIWNNAGHAVVVMFMVLATYQVGSLIISAIMNYINSNVTKVKI